MAKKLNPTYNELKAQTLNSRCSTEKLKNAIRMQFRSRLKKIRDDHLLNARKLTNGLNNLQISNNNHWIESSGLRTTDILQILEEEVKNELNLVNAEFEYNMYERENEAFIEDILQNVQFCPVCAKVSENQNSQGSFQLCSDCNICLKID